ncbi:MAG: acyltransferase [Bacteroidaceae bacterium]|nr:acyltransferase [Bacteroidaceae bacterium]
MEKSCRVVFLDWLRLIACFMVILVHCIEPFYYGGTGGLYIDTYSDACWVTLLNTPLRAAVPLFILTSSYLLVPVKTDLKTFIKKRLMRVLIPFLIWSILYAVVPIPGSGGSVDVVGNLKSLVFNFVMTSSGHMWFVYMLLGIYLLMPIVSPWLEKISKKEEKAFLWLWAFTTILPLLKPLAEKVTGSSNLWGECQWNEFGTFYYVSGFIGYVVLGHYIRTYVGESSWKKTLAYAVPFWIVGYVVSAGGFWSMIPIENGFPVSGSYTDAFRMEAQRGFCTVGIMLQTVAYFLVISKIKCDGWFYKTFVLPLSKLSYGMYLMHMFVLTPVFAMVSGWTSSTPVVMVVSALITFIFCALLSRLISFLPKSKYIVG